MSCSLCACTCVCVCEHPGKKPVSHRSRGPCIHAVVHVQYRKFLCRKADVMGAGELSLLHLNCHFSAVRGFQDSV